MAKTREKVRGMTDGLPSAEFTINGRTYELVPFFKEGESSVKGDTMVERAVNLSANLGEEDGAFILKHQNEIPQEFRRKFFLVFTSWRPSSSPRYVACLNWSYDHWCQNWGSLVDDWSEVVRLVRRRLATNPA